VTSPELLAEYVAYANKTNADLAVNYVADRTTQKAHVDPAVGEAMTYIRGLSDLIGIPPHEVSADAIPSRGDIGLTVSVSGAEKIRDLGEILRKAGVPPYQRKEPAVTKQDQAVQAMRDALKAAGIELADVIPDGGAFQISVDVAEDIEVSVDANAERVAVTVVKHDRKAQKEQQEQLAAEMRRLGWPEGEFLPDGSYRFGTIGESGPGEVG
jgi:hypothetical protein